MITDEERQAILDNEHLRLLSISYSILGGIHVVFGFVPLIYVVMGALFIGGFDAMGSTEAANLAFAGWLFVFLGSAFALAMWFGGALQLWAGRCLKHREARTLCLITAALTCISIPHGTAVGVFTFIVLHRQSVEMMFDPMFKASRVVQPQEQIPPPDNVA